VQSVTTKLKSRVTQSAVYLPHFAHIGKRIRIFNSGNLNTRPIALGRCVDVEKCMCVRVCVCVREVNVVCSLVRTAGAFRKREEKNATAALLEGRVHVHET
jgi:hypothetical protein